MNTTNSARQQAADRSIRMLEFYEQPDQATRDILDEAAGRFQSVTNDLQLQVDILDAAADDLQLQVDILNEAEGHSQSVIDDLQLQVEVGRACIDALTGPGGFDKLVDSARARILQHAVTQDHGGYPADDDTLDEEDELTPLS